MEKVSNREKIKEMRENDYDDFLRRNYFEQAQPPMVVAYPK